MKYIIAMGMAISFLLVGCNTVSGVGKDLERGGEHIQDASEDIKESM